MDINKPIITESDSIRPFFELWGPDVTMVEAMEVGLMLDGKPYDEDTAWSGIRKACAFQNRPVEADIYDAASTLHFPHSLQFGDVTVKWSCDFDEYRAEVEETRHLEWGEFLHATAAVSVRPFQGRWKWQRVDTLRHFRTPTQSSVRGERTEKGTALQLRDVAEQVGWTDLMDFWDEELA